MQIVGNGLGQIIHIPVVIVRGAKKGPVLGLTAAVHGNELNGMHIIHRIVGTVDPKKLAGTIVAVPVVNVPGYLSNERRFNDGRDLNRMMPGSPAGRPSSVYAYRFINRIVESFEYLVDLHTASEGRANSFYVRADMSDKDASWMAYAQRPQIILHNKGEDGTLRNAAMNLGIPSITVEVGNPQRYQKKMVDMGTQGVINVMAKLGMIHHDLTDHRRKPIVCLRSFWMYTAAGGVLQVLPELTDRVEKGELVARVLDIYGNTVEEYHTEDAGIVIGKSVNPVNQTGSRILHLGIVAGTKEIRESILTHESPHE